MDAQEIKKLMTPEIIQAQKEYKVKTFFDLVNALIEHPAWLEILRRLIISTSLLELPAKFEAFLEEFKEHKSEFKELKEEVKELKEEFKEFKEETKERLDRVERDIGELKQDVTILKQDVAILKQDVTILKQDVAILKQDVAILKQDVAILKQDVAILKQDVDKLKKDVSYLMGEFGRFKGREFERTIRERYYAYFGRILKRSRKIEIESLLPVIEALEEKGVIDERQSESLLQIDLVMEGMIKQTGKQVALAVEVSYSVYEDDLERAMERADILSHVLQKEVIPTIVGVEVSEEVAKKAEETGILLIKVSY